MGKGGGKVEVTKYYMSQHLGVCCGPVDAFRRVVVKEKVAWEGRVTSLSSVEINRNDLFGGATKEGGVNGTIHFLPGAPDQLLPDNLAQRLGRANGADCPGYRGIASLFFTGLAVPEYGARGFYWTANSPYLPTIEVEVERAPVGLDPAIAMIPRGGAAPLSFDLSDTFPFKKAGVHPDYPFAVSLHPGSLTLGPYAEDKRFVAITNLVADDGFIFNGDNVGYFFETGTVVAELPAGETLTIQVINTIDVECYGAGVLGVESIADLDANPAHIIYECLIEDMGAPASAIDFDSFSAAAQTLYDEGFGLSLLWSRQSTVETFINEVIDHIQATLFVNPRTGLLTLKLIRADYDVATLREITIDNADLTNFQRKAWGEITNEIVVTWTNPDTEQEETVTVQDLAGIASQNGAIISNGRNYYGVRTSALAMKLAVRDLRISAAPLASCDVELDRTHWDLLPGEVVKVTWAEHGLDQVVMRVGPVDYGRPGEPVIKAPLVEDVFGFDTADYSDPPGTAWEDGSQQPEPMTFSRIITTPAYFAAPLLADAGVSATYPQVLAAVLASSSNSDTFEYDVLGPTVAGDGTVTSEVQSTNTVLGHALLTAALPAEAESAAPSYSTPVGTVQPAQNVFVFIGADSDGEDKMEIALITLDGSDVVWSRGLFDTVPRAWPIGTPLWFVATDSTVSDLDLKADGETVSYELLSRTSLGTLDAASAPTISATMSDRPYLPNRPAAVTIGGVQFTTALTPVDMSARSDPWVTVTWAVRNRLMEDGQVVKWTDGTVVGETDQTTKVTVLAADGTTVLATHAGLSGTSFDIPDASFGSAQIAIVRVGSVRTDADGTFESLQSHDLHVRLSGISFDSTLETFDTTAHGWDEI